ncbi:MAG: nucleoside triphosphate pyrophosphohydrolase family protein [Cyanobacteria bacterium J06638_20]
MLFDEYQEKAAEFASDDLPREVALTVWALGLCGEAGEVADHIKKHVGHGHPLNRDYIKKELGDVLWYISALSDWLDMSIEGIAIQNIDKLKARYPEGFSQEASLNRVS